MKLALVVAMVAGQMTWWEPCVNLRGVALPSCPNEIHAVYSNQNCYVRAIANGDKDIWAFGPCLPIPKELQ